MAAPDLVHNYPSDADTGIPVGEAIYLYFDYGVDLQTLKSSVVLFGNDFDQTSGPDQALWLDEDTGDNPYWLSSPGFKGIVPIVLELEYYDTTDPDRAVTDPGTVTAQADEVLANAGHRVKILPEAGSLAPDLAYTLYVNGVNVENDGIGVSSRTVFDIEPDVGNVGTTGEFRLYGTYTGESADTVNVKITTSGDIGTAKYKWWLTSLGEGSAVSGRVTARRFRELGEGLQIRFTGSGFVADDLYTFNVSPPARMATSYSIRFTTNDGSWSTAPADPSTPAPSSPPTSLFPGLASGTLLEIVSMEPRNGSYMVDTRNREIVIEFSDDLFAASVTDESVKLWAYPVSGHYSDTSAPRELPKELVVSGSTLTIKF